MVVGLAVANFGINPADYVVWKCARAHREQSAGGYRVDVKTRGAMTDESATYVLLFDRSKGVDLTVRRKGSLRVVVTKDAVYEHDSSTNQYCENPRIEGSDAEVLKHTVGVMDELVSRLVDGEGIKGWLQDTRTTGTWTFGTTPGALSCESRTSDGTVAVVLDSDTSLLRKVVMKMGDYGSEWTLQPLPKPEKIAFSPPAGAYKTSEIRPEIAPPAYASKEAKAACEKVFARYDNPKLLGYRVTWMAEATEVRISRGRIAQKDSVATWLLADKVLTLATKDVTVSGTSTSGQAIEAVAKAGTRVEPVLRLLMRGINPFRFYLGQSMTVRIVGRTKVDGEPCTILEGSSRSGKVSLIARLRDGFVHSLLFTPAGNPQVYPREFKELPVNDSEFIPPAATGPKQDVKSYLGQSEP